MRTFRHQCIFLRTEVNVVFSATFSNVSVSAAQDIFELVAPSNSRMQVRGIAFGQHSDAGI
jgi:hypothetical protein